MIGRRLGRLGLAGFAVGLAIAALPASAAAAPQQAHAEVRSPGLSVINQNLEVAPNGSFSVYLRVANAPADSDIAVDIYNPITDAADLAASTTESPAHLRANFVPFQLADQAMASQQTGFTISLFTRGEPRPPGSGAWGYRLDQPGVYPVRVRLRDTDGNELAAIVTYLVRTPADVSTVSPARVALLATVTQPPVPHKGRTSTPVSSTYTDALSAVLGKFRSHPDVPASFAVTPDTTSRLKASEGGTNALASLRTEANRPTRDLLGAPYVDIDPARLVNASLTDEVVRQADLGQRTLTKAMDQPGSNTWVLDHHVDVASIEALHNVGVAHLILPSTALVGSGSAQPVLLPTATGLNAVASSVFDLRGPAPDDATLAAYQLLGRLAAVGSITPNGAGLVVRLDPATVDQRELTTVLNTLAAPATYLEPTTVTRLFQEVPTTTTPVATLAPANTSSLGDYPDELRATNAMVASYGSMLPDPTVAVRTFETSVAISADDRLRNATRLAILGNVQTQVQRRMQAISLPARDRVTLGARDARFPLPISSSSSEPLKVVITLEASDRLAFRHDRIETVLRGERTTVQIPVRTRATGDTPLRITIRTPDGQVILAESQYTIRSTAVSGVGLLLTIGAGGFLALWWGRHWYRTRRDRDAAAAEPPPPDEPAPTDPSADDDIFVGPPM